MVSEVVELRNNYRVKLVDNQLNDLSGKEYTTQSSVIIETGNVITMRFQNKIVLNAWVMGVEHDLIKALPMDYTKG